MQQMNTEGVHDLARLDGKGDLMGIMQKVEFWPYCQILYAQIRICPRKWDA